MEFKKAFINGVTYGFDEGEIDFSWNRFWDRNFKFSDPKLPKEFKAGNLEVDLFLKVLALNHTVMPEYEEIIVEEVEQKTNQLGTMKYQASS